MSGHGGGRARGGGDHEEGHEGADERWLLSYADFITLLLALFMVLFALSTVDRNKFAQFRTGLVSAFDSSANASPTVPGGTGLLQESSLVKAAGTSKELKETKPGPITDNPASTAKAAAKIKAQLKSKGLAGDVHIEQTSRGLVIQLLTDHVFFSSGSAGLAGPGATVIDTVGNALKDLPNAIAVEGHTDNQPIHSAQYPTNWELSSGRADTVLRRLTEQDGLNPAHLQATGYADQRPVASNDTDTDRARNRRVEIVVLTDTPAATADTATTTTTSTASGLSASGSPPEVPDMAPLLPMTGSRPEAPAAAAAEKKSKKKLFIIVGLVLLLGGGGAYETVLKPKPKVVLGKDGKPVKVVVKIEGGETIRLDPVTTSIADGHVIQIALGLRLVKGGDTKAITTQAPQADDAALRVLSTYTYKVLLSPTGREKASKQIKAAVIKQVVTDAGKQQIFDVFLPTYVLQ